ncbi:MAG: hypothetical protein DBX55_03475 [Verrucomicrobia bacterium]|nr:MAG: hypothetical protein DBX55_03475 [Verrucomicrobiota bacterium]
MRAGRIFLRRRAGKRGDSEGGARWEAQEGIKKLDDSGDLNRTVKSNVSRGKRGEVIYEYE